MDTFILHRPSSAAAQAASADTLETNLVVRDGFEFEYWEDAGGFCLVSPIGPFEVDGVRYDGIGCHARQMIELILDRNGGAASRQCWNNPPTEAELDRYVTTGAAPGWPRFPVAPVAHRTPTYTRRGIR